MTVTVRLVVLEKDWPVAVKVTWVTLTGTAMLAVLRLAVSVLERLSENEVPLGAGPLKVIVPVEVSPPPIDVGLNKKPLGAGGCTVSVVVCETPPLDAVMVTPVEVATADGLVTVNVAVVLPAGTITFDGTPTMAGLALKVTLSPPAGAAPVSVTVPVTFDVFPTTEVGFTATLLGTIAPATVRVADCDPPR